MPLTLADPDIRQKGAKNFNVSFSNLISAASIWFEIWASWIQVKKIQFFQAISQSKNRFFMANFQKNSIFLDNLPKNFISIFQGKFPKNFDFFRKFHKKSIFQGTAELPRAC